MDAVRHISKLLSTSNHAFFKIMALELSRYGITLPQALVIDVIKESPKTMGELSKALDLSYSTISGIVDRLERSQIVTRTRDENDRRIVWVSFTSDLEVLKKTYPILEEDYFPQLLADMLNDLPQSEITMLHRALQLLDTRLEHKQRELAAEKGERT
jgi:DNA-binding MarR family transcriptional regulator